MRIKISLHSLCTHYRGDKGTCPGGKRRGQRRPLQSGILGADSLSAPQRGLRIIVLILPTLCSPGPVDLHQKQSEGLMKTLDVSNFGFFKNSYEKPMEPFENRSQGRGQCLLVKQTVPSTDRQHNSVRIPVSSPVLFTEGEHMRIFIQLIKNIIIKR